MPILRNATRDVLRGGVSYSALGRRKAFLKPTEAPVGDEQGNGSFAPQGISANGSTYWTLGADVGAASAYCLLSVPINPGAIGTTQAICRQDTNQFQVNVRAGGNIEVIGKNAANTTILDIRGSTVFTADAGWKHLLIAIDMFNQANTKMLINGVAETLTVNTFATSGDLAINFAGGGNFGVCAKPNGIAPYTGGISTFWIYPGQWLDLTVTANVEKFFKDGKVVYPGSDGSTPLSSQPPVYLEGDASVWNTPTNKGSLGNGSVTGAFTDAATDPSGTGGGGGSPEISYMTPVGVSLNGTDQGWKLGTFIHALSTKTVLAQGWFNPDDDETSGFLFGTAFNSRLFYNTDRLTFIGKSTTQDVVRFDGSSRFTSGTGWKHWMLAVDMDDQTKIHLLINGVPETLTFTTFVEGGEIDWAGGGDFGIGYKPNNETSFFKGGVSTVWVDPTQWADLSDPNVVSKWFANGQQVDLGADGSTPTGTQPPLYVKGDVTSGWATNDGSLSNGTVFGSPTDSSVDPHDPPGNPAGDGGSGGPVGTGSYWIPRGYFMRANQDGGSGYFSAARWDRAAAEPECRGFVPIIPWRAVETSEGVYNWAPLDDAISNAKSRGLELIIYLRLYLFSGDGRTLPAGVPDYILNDHNRFGGLSGSGGVFRHSTARNWRVAKWVPAVTERICQLHEAFYSYVSTHADGDIVKALVTNELADAPAAKITQWSGLARTPERIRDAVLKIVDRSCDARVRQNFIQPINYFQEAEQYIPTVYDRLVLKNAMAGIVDPLTPSGGFNGNNAVNEGMQQCARQAIPVYNHGEKGAGAYEQLNAIYADDGSRSLEHMFDMLYGEQIGMNVVCTCTQPTLNENIGGTTFDFEEVADFFRTTSNKVSADQKARWASIIDAASIPPAA